MAWLPNPIACDVCGVLKQPSNHWLYADVDGHAFRIMPWDDEAENREENYLHICGSECAIKKLAEWMSRQTPA